MIFPTPESTIERCWFLCNQEYPDCAWFSFSQSQELCWLMKNCPEKSNTSEWISSNGDCHDPESNSF